MGFADKLRDVKEKGQPCLVDVDRLAFTLPPQASFLTRRHHGFHQTRQLEKGVATFARVLTVLKHKPCPGLLRSQDHNLERHWGHI